MFETVSLLWGPKLGAIHPEGHEACGEGGEDLEEVNEDLQGGDEDLEKEDEDFEEVNEDLGEEDLKRDKIPPDWTEYVSNELSDDEVDSRVAKLLTPDQIKRIGSLKKMLISVFGLSALRSTLCYRLVREI